MSGEFGEDFKPAKGSDLGKEQPAEQQSPFHAELQNERAAASKAADSKVDEKVDNKKVSDSTSKHAEGSAEWLAENRTPAENFAALEKSLNAALAKYKTLQDAGCADMVSGGSYLANLVKDGTPADVSKFLTNVKDYLEKK